MGRVVAMVGVGIVVMMVLVVMLVVVMLVVVVVVVGMRVLVVVAQSCKSGILVSRIPDILKQMLVILTFLA